MRPPGKLLALSTAAAGTQNSQVFILRNGGGGALRKSDPFPTAEPPFRMASGDLNGDGEKDLVASYFSYQGRSFSVSAGPDLLVAAAVPPESVNFILMAVKGSRRRAGGRQNFLSKRPIFW